MNRAAEAIDRLLDVMARLRHPEHGCPWDRQQSFATIAPYTIEEAYEVAEAIRQSDSAALRAELGDLLFQVVFHARMAEEAGLFSFADVASELALKIRRRHPHVFGGEAIESASAQTEAWEAHKEAERQEKDARTLDGVPLALPALSRALKLQARAARVGFDWPDQAPILEKIEEEIAELKAAHGSHQGKRREDRLREEMGDLLFALVNFARHLDIDAEAALANANAKFERRFRRIEALLAESGKRPQDATLAEMDALWDQVKRAEEGEKS
jgi:MazG family protein